MAIVVSNDGHSDELCRALDRYPVHYHSPPLRDAPGRDGAAKAGNLNSALDELIRMRPDVAYVETRDADDEVGSHGFLRHCVGQLLAENGLAFVQTIKEAQVSAGDPFNNRESMFYRGQMLTRTPPTPCSRAGPAWCGAGSRCTTSATSRPGTWSRTSSQGSRRCLLDRLSRLPPLVVLGATTYWGGMHLVLFAKFVTYGWRGVRLGQRQLTETAAAAQPQLAIED